MARVGEAHQAVEKDLPVYVDEVPTVMGWSMTYLPGYARLPAIWVGRGGDARQFTADCLEFLAQVYSVGRRPFAV
jgi:hypothetical protein